MSQVATQHRIWAILSAGLGGAGILATVLASAGSIGFPDLFLIWSSSVVQEITLASTLIFIAASGFLITTHPQPVRTASVVGAIVILGGAIAVCCSLIAPGMLAAVTAGITYVSAFVFVSATFSQDSIELVQSNDDKKSLLLKLIAWFALGLLGAFWLAITSFKQNGIFAAFWLFGAPLTPCSVWLSFAFIKQTFNRSRFYKLALVLFSIYLLAVVIIISGWKLYKQGALVYIIEVIVLAFAIATALLLNLYVNPVSRKGFSQIEFQPILYKFSTFIVPLWFASVLPFAIVSSFWGYSNYFEGGITSTERLNSLRSATLLDKVLNTNLSNIRITISPDEHFLVNGGESKNEEKTVQLWNLKTGMLTRTFPGYSDPLIVNDRSSQPILLMHNPAGHVEQWNLMNDQPQKGNKPDEKLLWQKSQPPQTSLPRLLPRDAILLASSTDGKTLATGFDSSLRRGRLLLWDTTTGKLICSLSPGGYDRNSGVFSLSSHLLADASTGNIYLWRLPRRS